jgi:metal-responsive CopG/Arc/MetJ family transcriptional regulator
MRRSELLVASLPPEMMREVERLKKLEHRTRSELVREALRNYFALRAKFREEDPTVADLRAINEGRRQHAQGETMPLKKALRELHRRTYKARNKAADGNSAR